MTKAWWTIGAVCLAAGAALAGLGFVLFDSRSFAENLIAEGFGILVGVGVIIWLIEGRALTRQQRVRDTLVYRREISQEVWNFAHIFAREIAQPIAGDFDPPIDLYDHERGDWREFKPLLRKVFRLAIDVPHQGLPPYVSLSEDDARCSWRPPSTE